MKRYWWIAFIAALVLGLGSGYSTYERMVTNNDHFCTLDTTLVVFIDKSLAGATKAQIRADIAKGQITAAEYNQAYRQDAGLVNQLREQSPCKILVSTPPNVLKGNPATRSVTG